MAAGLRDGLRTGVWLLKIMIPVSFVVTVLSWLGILQWMSAWLNPVFHVVGLPAETIVPYVTGAFLNIYSAIAALGALPLDDRQVTILALMCLIAHNLPVESAVQHKAGTPMRAMLALRLTTSLLSGLLLNWMLPPDGGEARARGVAAAATAGWGPMLAGWGTGVAWLAGKVIVIVTSLMILQNALREFGLIRPLAAGCAPALWLLGLPRRTAFMWIVSNTLGLAYGGAVLLKETQSGELSPQDVQLLNRSIGVCHSLLEDTLLFVAIGAWAFWITVPRLALAAGAVWLYRLWLNTVPIRPAGRGRRTELQENGP